MEEIKIRDFVDDDMKGVLEYRRQSARISFPGLRIDMAKAKASIVEHLQKYPGTLKVAEINDNVVGFIRFNQEDSPFGSYGQIGIIFVDEHHRRCSVGNNLLQEAERCLKASGTLTMKATVTITNSESMNFFKSNGYEEKRTVLNKILI